MTIFTSLYSLMNAQSSSLKFSLCKKSPFSSKQLSIYRFLWFDLIFKAKTEWNWRKNDGVFERRSFFSFGRTTAPISSWVLLGFGDHSSVLGKWPPQLHLGQLLDLAINWLVLRERPTMVLLFFFSCESWAIDRLILGEWPATVLLNF